MELQQREDFKKLDQPLRHFISQYALGYTKLQDLVSTEALSIRSHTTNETLRAENAVKSHVTVELSTVKTQLMSHMMIGLENASDQISQGVEKLGIATMHVKRREQFLASLKYPSMNERRNHITPSFGNTSEWILDEDDSEDDSEADGSTLSAEDRVKAEKPWDNFNDWLKSDNSIYWISGKPGSGKSTLVKFVISSPRAQALLNMWSPNTLVLSHFLWKPGSRMQNNIKGLLCSLLHQALSHNMDVLDSALEISPSTKDSDTDWSVSELKHACQSVFLSYPSPLCIFIDGIDEICDEDGAIALMEVVAGFRAIPRVKVCVAGRPELRFSRRLRDQ